LSAQWSQGTVYGESSFISTGQQVNARHMYFCWEMLWCNNKNKTRS